MNVSRPVKKLLPRGLLGRSLLIVLVPLVALPIGCGAGGPSTTPPGQVLSKNTTASEVHEMVAHLEGDEHFEARYAARIHRCKSEHSAGEYRAACVRPFAPELRRRFESDQAFISRQFRRVGEGCRKAIERGEPYDPLEDRTLAACEQDIGE